MQGRRFISGIFSRRTRAALAAVLAILMASPLPAGAQMSPGIQMPGIQPLPGQEGQPSLDQRPALPRVMREFSAFPTISIDDPRNGAIITREDQSITVTYADARNELDLSSFRAVINGVDRTREFQVSQSGATWQPQSRQSTSQLRDATTERQMALQRQGLLGQNPLDRQYSQYSMDRQNPDQVTRTPGVTDSLTSLPAFVQGQNTIVVSIKNLSGNLATSSVAFILDTSTMLTTRALPRSPLERAFLQPPTPPPSESVRRAAPTGPSISRDLTQFGYDMFVSLLPSLTPAANLPVSPDYRLGPGDNLILYVWNVPGSSLYDTTTLVVDRGGTVFVPRVGSVPLQGLNLVQAQETLRSRVSRYFSGFELRLALGELRGISVYVVGEVARPGTYTISPFSTLLDALVAAGGPTKMGSLRAVRLVRNGAPVEDVDLYNFLLRGERSLGPTLEAGDTVFVPPIGPVAGITGEVKRPGIYELRPGTTMGALLAMAGGPLPTAQFDRVQVERQGGEAGKRILDLAFAPSRGSGASELLQDGDLVTIFPGQDRLRNAVTLEGYVRTPGQYEWKPGMRVSELLKPDMLLPESYTKRVEVVRMRPDFSREILDVDFRKLWAGGVTPDPTQDLALQPLDIISVKSEVLGPETVTVRGQVRRPGKYSIVKGERLSSLIERAGGFLPEAFPRGAVFIRESIRQVEQQQLDKFMREQEQTILAESAATTTGALQSGGSDLINATAAATAQRRELLRSLTSLAAVGRLSVHVDAADKLKGTPDDIPLEDGDSLYVPQQPTSVLIVGAVRNSTSLLYKPDQTAQYYIDQAGGPRREADIDQTYILKPDGTTVSSFMKMRKVEAGDSIVVPLSTEPKFQKIPLIKDIATIMGNIFLPIGVIGGLLK